MAEPALPAAANAVPPTSFADVLNALPPALADYIRDLAEVSAAPIDRVAMVVLRALGSVTADGLSEQARAELEALVSGQVVKTELTERGAQTRCRRVAPPASSAPRPGRACGFVG